MSTDPSERTTEPGNSHPSKPAGPEKKNLVLLVSEWIRIQMNVHLSFWIMAGLSLYVLLMVPQVKNVWYQFPPLSIWFWAYGAFLLLLVTFYLGSLMFVLRLPFADSDALKRPTPKWYAAIGAVPSAMANTLQAIADKLDRVPEAVGAALPDASASGTQITTRRHGWRLVVAVLFVAAAGAAAMVLGADSASSKTYSLGGSFCQKHAVLLLLIAAWLFSWALLPVHRTGATWYVGRLLSWAFWTACIGECIWFLASTDAAGSAVSYRVYTIWAVMHGLAFAVLLGLLVDKLNGIFQRVPIRAIAFVGLIVALGTATRPESLATDDATRFSRGDLLVAMKTAPANIPDAGVDERWFDHLEARIKTIPKEEGPVVLVAASGGGSRAAIFTTLVLETLSRTPLDPQRAIAIENGAEPDVRTWADNTVMISSVSGGSLSTAYFAHRLHPDPKDANKGRSRQPVTVEKLRNTTDTELIDAMANLSQRQLEGILASQKDANEKGAAAIF